MTRGQLKITRHNRKLSAKETQEVVDAVAQLIVDHIQARGLLSDKAECATSDEGEEATSGAANTDNGE